VEFAKFERLAQAALGVLDDFGLRHRWRKSSGTGLTASAS